MRARRRRGSPEADHAPDPDVLTRYPQPQVVPELDTSPKGIGRRRFLGYVLAAPTLVVAARLVADDAAPQMAAAAIPSLPELSDLYDLGDLQDLAASATAGLISITVNRDGTAAFALPRAEVGQGITTSIGMIIADEMDLPLSDVIITLADARPELLFNQFTGGSNTTRSLYQAVRVAAATARARLMTAAASKWGVPVSSLTAKNGVITSSTGTTATYGSLATAAAATQASSLSVQTQVDIGLHADRDPAEPDRRAGLGDRAQDLHYGPRGPRTRCRPWCAGLRPSTALSYRWPTWPRSRHAGHHRRHVVSTGVAVRGATFGQCIDAVDALNVTWGPGSEDSKSDATVLAELKNAEMPLLVPPVSLLATTIEGEFTFYFRSNSPLETNCAIADVRRTGPRSGRG